MSYYFTLSKNDFSLIMVAGDSLIVFCKSLKFPVPMGASDPKIIFSETPLISSICP